jgi:Domain of unknown function (DUF4328)/Protein of unknown function (DUF2510)
LTQPGWYPDPASPFSVRWWDGQRWTNDTHAGDFQTGSSPVAGFPAAGFPAAGFPAAGFPAAGFPAAGLPAAGFRPDAGYDIAEETKAGGMASKALLFGACAYTGQFVIDALVAGPIWRAYRQWIDALQTNSAATLVLPRGAAALDAVSSIASLVLLVVAIFFLIWFHKAATVAAQAGVPARRSPGWAVGSWFIPIVNFWFPYQSAVDMFPPGHPARPMVKRWWGLWLATAFSAYVVIIGSVLATGVGLAMALVGAVLAFRAAAAGKAVIDEVNKAHGELVRR